MSDAQILGLLLNIVLCVLVAVIAKYKDKSFAGYLALSFFLTPLLGIIILLVDIAYSRNTKKKQQSDDNKKDET